MLLQEAVILKECSSYIRLKWSFYAGGNMKENELAILNEYEIDVKHTRKVRDAVLCEASQGLFLIKEMRLSEKRLSVLNDIGEHLQANGYEQIDWILKTKEGEFYTTSEEGMKYFLKRWFAGRECDVHKEKDVLEAVANLTKIHHALCNVESSVSVGDDLRETFFRHNREMKKVRSFMRERVGKSDFELAFLKHFDNMYASAEYALACLKESNYGDLLKESIENQKCIHGDYNYHNVLMIHDGIASTNFEHVERNIQITDFYYFLRKVMEKNHWDISLGDKMLECYQKQIPFKKGEMEYVAICLAYPEKFWKVANSYGRSRKVWIPAKNLEKLELVIRQTEEKRFFLKEIFSFQL